MSQPAIDYLALTPCKVLPSTARFGDSLELAMHLMESDAVAMNLQALFQLTGRIDRSGGAILAPIEQVLNKVISAKSAARTLNIDLSLFVCTEACSAVALRTDSDLRDHKYLTGMKTPDGLFAYCGGLDAAISRVHAYARHADVVCLKSSHFNPSEAGRFASEVRAAFPGKKLGFCYSPKSDGLRWNEVDHTTLERKLRRIGYSYYFFTQFGSTVFPCSPTLSHWALFDDAEASAVAIS